MNLSDLRNIFPHIENHYLITEYARDLINGDDITKELEQRRGTFDKRLGQAMTRYKREGSKMFK